MDMLESGTKFMDVSSVICACLVLLLAFLTCLAVILCTIECIKRDGHAFKLWKWIGVSWFVMLIVGAILGMVSKIVG